MSDLKVGQADIEVEAKELFKKIDKNNIPEHVAIIMDGNGRWAKDQGQDRLYGHFHGVESVRAAVEGCGELKVSYLTLYAFSTENWERPESEVNGLMELLVQTIRNESESLHKNNVKMHVIGDRTMLSEYVNSELDYSLNLTKNNTGLNLILALSYSSKAEIINAIKQIAKKVKDNELSVNDINDAVIHQHLYTANFPDPALMIRTSGEQRISNFLLYQLAYSELYFTEVRWPEFRKVNLFEAILDYQNRERRFGKTSDQIQNA